VAARKVADENRRLRTLLAEHGLADDSIEECLKSGSATGPDPLLEGEPGSPRSVGAAYLLDYVLYPGIHDYGYQNVEVPTTMMESDGLSRDHIVPSLWELTRLAQNEHVGRQYEDIYTIAQATSSSHQLVTPSSTGTCASMEIFIHDSGCDIQQQQRLGPVAPSTLKCSISKLHLGNRGKQPTAAMAELLSVPSPRIHRVLRPIWGISLTRTQRLMIDLMLNDCSDVCGEGYGTAMDEGGLGAVYESALPRLNWRVEK
jgi:hypothetical protein